MSRDKNNLLKRQATFIDSANLESAAHSTRKGIRFYKLLKITATTLPHFLQWLFIALQARIQELAFLADWFRLLSQAAFQLAALISGLAVNFFEFIVALYFYRKVNRNISKTSELVVLSIAAILSILSLILGIVLIGPAAAILLVVALGLKCLYSAGLLIYNLVQLAWISRDKNQPHYAERAAIYKQNIRHHGLNLTISALTLLGILAYGSLHIVFPPLILFTVFALVGVAVISTGVYQIYKKVRAAKTGEIQNEGERVKGFNASVAPTPTAEAIVKTMPTATTGIAVTPSLGASKAIPVATRSNSLERTVTRLSIEDELSMPSPSRTKSVASSPSSEAAKIEGHTDLNAAADVPMSRTSSQISSTAEILSHPILQATAKTLVSPPPPQKTFLTGMKKFFEMDENESIAEAIKNKSSFQEAKLYLLDKIVEHLLVLKDKEAKLEVRQEKTGERFAAWWERDKIRNKVKTLEKAFELVSAVEIDSNTTAATQAYVDDKLAKLGSHTKLTVPTVAITPEKAQEELKDISLSALKEGAFQSFWRTKGEVERRIDGSDMFFKRATATASNSGVARPSSPRPM